MYKRYIIKFCIIANARSGSTALAQAIRASSSLTYLSEPFNKDAHEWNKFFKKEDTFEERVAKVSQCSQDYFKTVTSYTGKLEESKRLINYCHNKYPTLFLIRYDLFHCTLSSMFAYFSQVWNIDQKNKFDKYNEFISDLYITEKEFLSWYDSGKILLQYYDDFICDNSDLINPFIMYEDLFDGPIKDYVWDKIQTVTGELDKEKFVGELARHKINGPETYKLFKNYNELKEKYGKGLYHG